MEVEEDRQQAHKQTRTRQRFGCIVLFSSTGKTGAGVGRHDLEQSRTGGGVVNQAGVNNNTASSCRQTLVQGGFNETELYRLVSGLEADHGSGTPSVHARDVLDRHMNIIHSPNVDWSQLCILTLHRGTDNVLR